MQTKTPIIKKDDLIAAVAAGLISGLLYAAPVFSPALGGFVSVFAGVALFAAGFGFGTVPVITAAAVGFAVCTALSNSLYFGGVYILTNGLPVAVAATLALRRKDNEQFYPLGKIAAWLSGYIAFLFICYDSYMSYTGITLQETLRSLMGSQLDIVLKNNPEVFTNIPEEAKEQTIEQWKTFFLNTGDVYPGVFMISSLVATAVNAFIALTLLNISNRKPLRSEFGFNNLVMPHWVAACAVITTVAASFSGDHIGFVATGLAMMFMTVEIIEGLAVIHNLAGKKDEKTKKRILWTIYLIIGIFGFPAFFVGLFGIADHFRNFRGLKK